MKHLVLIVRLGLDNKGCNECLTALALLTAEVMCLEKFNFLST